MDSTWLERQRILRDEAWDAVTSSSDFFAFKAFDDAVVSLGGTPLFHLDTPRFRSAMHNAIEATARRATEARKPSQGEAAEIALMKHGRPLHISVFLEAAVDSGAEVGGENPLANFRSTVSKDPRFVTIKRDGQYFWWLAHVALPPDWNEPVDPDLLMEASTGSSVSSNQEGGEGHAPATT